MNTQPPYPGQPQQPSPAPFRGLILAAQIITGVIIVCIIVTMAWTARLVGQHKMQEMQEVLTTDATVNQSAPPPAYTNEEADFQDEVNSQAYSDIRENIETLPNKNELFNTLMILNEESDKLYAQIELVRKEFSDTLPNATGAIETEFTQKFFMTTGRAAALKKSMSAYRESIISQLKYAGSENADDLREEMPMDDEKAASDVSKWDESKFTGPCVDAYTYLEELEIQVRTFEGAALSFIPQKTQ
jgi:hypothetical protein